MNATQTVETNAVVSTGETETMAQTIARLTAENAAIKAKLNAKTFRGLSFRVAKSGGVSVYGLGRFPVTLYREQWLKLMEGDFQANLKAFITENAALLKSKPAKEVAVETVDETTGEVLNETGTF